MAYGKVFEALRASCPHVWSEYTEHGFVKGLGDGSLSKEAFLTYLRQDYVFLIHFSRAWALAVTKAGNLAEMKAASSVVHALLHEEMQLHIGICAEAGISLEELENTAELPQNMLYTRYVLEAGYSGDFLDMMAALAPCVMGYGEIGDNLDQAATSKTYREWIDTYAAADYQALCADLGALIDQAVISRLGDAYQQTGRWQTLQKHFETATRLERDFWGMAFEAKDEA
ncbi:thiaminase II [Terasakiella pusilla]|uniref:thiaminase II n=1 Tax=Terasakiella pusilla TaxID=64973 RepID=UPI003AA7BD26